MMEITVKIRAIRILSEWLVWMLNRGKTRYCASSAMIYPKAVEQDTSRRECFLL
jgi:hypothetical protein